MLRNSILSATSNIKKNGKRISVMKISENSSKFIKVHYIHQIIQVNILYYAATLALTST